MQLFRKSLFSPFIREVPSGGLKRGKIFVRTFLATVLFALMWAIALSPKVNAMTPHPPIVNAMTPPPIVNCTTDQDGITRIVPVPTGTETWRCTSYYKVFDNDPSTPKFTAGWALVSASPNPSSWDNYQSNMYMVVQGYSRANGAQIVQYPGTPINNGKWTMQSTGTPGYLKAVNVNSHQCMGVEDKGSTARGARMIQWTCNGNDDQAWIWVWNGKYDHNNEWPVWNIVNKKSSLCLGIDNGSTQSLAPAIQWNCNANNDQNWF